MPDVNIDEALASAAYETRALSSSQASAASPDRPQLPRQASESISEVVPAQADGFDWQEDVNDLADGMAALSVEPTGTGYLGMVVFRAPPDT
jgi:transcriptional regulatory protein GAL4